MPAHSPEPFFLDSELRRDCDAAIRTGSKSFMAASMLLPPRSRTAARALYAFCRSSDDLIDDEENATGFGTTRLRHRLGRIYAGRPADNPGDRAFAAAVSHFGIPRLIPDAMVEGFQWDEENRRYQTIDELCGYGARVAGTVGLMMCIIMGVRRRSVLSRAGDLGLAMQLTNIARDVGEDARRGRIYLPLDWLAEAGIDPGALLRDPKPSPQLRQITRRLLETADAFYLRAMTGIAGLPPGCRIAIRSAALIYRDIGRDIAGNGFDSVTYRAHTSGRRKLKLVAAAAMRPVATTAVSIDPPHPSMAALVDATSEAGGVVPVGLGEKAGRMIELMALAEQRRRANPLA
jgi:phytoene synthase